MFLQMAYFVLFGNWIIFHCISVPHLLYSFLCWWIFSLLPCPGYCHCWWECKLVQPLWRTVWSFLKKLRLELTICARNPTLRHIPRENHNTHVFWEMVLLSISSVDFISTLHGFESKLQLELVICPWTSYLNSTSQLPHLFHFDYNDSYVTVNICKMLRTEPGT